MQSENGMHGAISAILCCDAIFDVNNSIKNRISKESHSNSR